MQRDFGGLQVLKSKISYDMEHKIHKVWNILQDQLNQAKSHSRIQILLLVKILKFVQTIQQHFGKDKTEHPHYGGKYEPYTIQTINALTVCCSSKVKIFRLEPNSDSHTLRNVNDTLLEALLILVSFTTSTCNIEVWKKNQSERTLPSQSQNQKEKIKGAVRI